MELFSLKRNRADFLCGWTNFKTCDKIVTGHAVKKETKCNIYSH